jgi:hypothetical protein
LIAKWYISRICGIEVLIDVVFAVAHSPEMLFNDRGRNEKAEEFDSNFPWGLPWGTGKPVGSASWGLDGREWSRGDGIFLLALYTGIIPGNRRS